MTTPPAATPWAFRHRGFLLGMAYAVSSLVALSLYKWDLWPGTPIDRYLALDSRLWLGQRLDAPAGPVWQMALPVALLTVCFALRSWGTSYLRGHIMADKAMHSDRLIVAGPFRWVRNPLYLGNLFMAAAFGLLLPPPGLLLVLALHVAVLATLSGLEGRGLRAQHGAAYDAYARKVHAFLPLPPRSGVPDSPVKPDWRNGLSTEAWHIGFAAYLVGLAMRDSIVIWVGVGISFLVLLVNRERNRRTRGTQPPTT